MAENTWTAVLRWLCSSWGKTQSQCCGFFLTISTPPSKPGTHFTWTESYPLNFLNTDIVSMMKAGGGTELDFIAHLNYWCIYLPVHNFKRHMGLPWWFSGKESTYECRRHRFHPWSRKIPHAVWSNQAHAKQLLSQHSNNQELHLLKAVGPRAHAPQQEKPPQREARKRQLEGSPHSPEREKIPQSKEDSVQPEIK